MRCGTPSGIGRCRLSSQRILGSLSSKGGERKRLTILFADIRNSTNLMDGLGDPELGMRRLEPVLKLMKDIVHRYDGIVNEVQGDGVMALFGAPRPREDHAVCGCLAASGHAGCDSRGLTMPICGSVSACTPAKLSFRRVKTAYTRPTTRRARTYIWQIEWSKWRMRAASSSPAIPTPQPNSSWRSSHSACRPFVGITAPIKVFRLTGLLNAPASDVFRSGRRLSQLIGRSDQFAALELELASTVKGDGRVVGVVGEAGIGKSRLCFEFAESCRRSGIRVFEARVLGSRTSHAVSAGAGAVARYFRH